MKPVRPYFVFFLLWSLLGCTSAAPSAPATLPQIPTFAPTPTPGGFGGCEDARLPTPAAPVNSIFPPVTASDYTLGAEDAAVTALVYSDFQCEGCAGLALTLRQIQQTNPGKVRLAFRHFPLLTSHDKAALAMQAADAAGLQGKFWEMHDRLFSAQPEWVQKSPPEFETWLGQQAKSLGLDSALFLSDLKSPALTSRVQDAWQSGNQMGLPGVPLLLLNGEILPPPYVFATLPNIISLYALPAQQFSQCPPQALEPGKTYTARLLTSKGEVRIALFAEKAPLTVNNFLFLAQSGWYDGVPFHHVLPGRLAQTGDPSGTGLGNPGYFIKTELVPGLRFDRAGMVGMANVGGDTGGSQFFITLAPANDLTGKYAVFGEVISGMEVLNQLTAHDPSTGTPQEEPDLLLRVVVEQP